MSGKRKRRLLRIGVTGGIGGGKSAVCEFFRRLGVVVLSADEIARQLADADPEIKWKIKREFGPDSFTEDGMLNRKRMAEVVFADRRKRERLNAITHPSVLKRIDEKTARLEKEGETPFIIHEAALIYEASADKDLDFVVVVDADEETRIQRVMKRDGVSREEVLKRINSQMSAARKRDLADFVIINDGNLKSLEEKVRFLYSLFSRLGAASS